MSVSLDREMFNEVVSFIQPHVETVQAQQGLVQTALSDADNLRSLIQYGGGARTFAVLLTRKCLDFGTLPNGEHALSAVLSEIYYRVGESEQKRIDDIQLEIEQQVDTVKGKPVVDRVDLPEADNTRAKEHIFISYASDDRHAFVEKYTDALRDAGYKVWVDNLGPSKGGIVGGEQWPQSLANALNRAAVVNLIITPDSVRSRWVHAEIRRAKELNCTIMPVVARTIKTEQDEQALKQLNVHDIHYIDVTKLGYDDALDRVLTDLDRQNVPKNR